MVESYPPKSTFSIVLGYNNNVHFDYIVLRSSGSRESRSSSSSSFCSVHPVEPVVSYCRDCERALCKSCRSVVGGSGKNKETDNGNNCQHLSCSDLSTAARTGRTQLDEDERVNTMLVSK